MPRDHDTITIDAVPPFPESDAPASAGAAPSNASESRDDARARDQLFHNDEPAETQVLDDDAFFASLREAVRDDRPLGPPEHHDYEADEDDDSGRFGNVFKRRR